MAGIEENHILHERGKIISRSYHQRLRQEPWDYDYDYEYVLTRRFETIIRRRL